MEALSELNLTPSDGTLTGTLRLATPGADRLPAEHATRPLTLTPVRDELYVSRFPGEQRLTPAVFFSIDEQDYPHIGGRAFLRTSQALAWPPCLRAATCRRPPHGSSRTHIARRYCVRAP